MRVSDSTPRLPPAGWYPDPAGGPNRRWWDGTHWTERMETPAATTDPVPAAAYPVAAVADSSPSPTTSRAVSPNTWAFWVVALLPIVSIVSVALVDVEGYLRRTFSSIALSGSAGASVDLNVFTLAGPTFVVAQVLGLLVLAAFIVFAALDYRILVARGVDRPFHWAWSFFTLVSGGSLVYLIGRTVVAHRRTGRSASAPMWVSIGLGLVLLIVILVKFFTAFGAVIPDLSQLSR